MKSFTFFRTEEGNYYLYNSRKSSLLNVHPVIKVIEALDNNDGEETLFAKIMNQNLEIGDDEKRLLLDKYLFLRDNGFFEEINEEDFIDGKITPEIVEKQIAFIDNVLFQVTGNCNLRCQYCCYGDMYSDKVEKKNLSFETVETVLNYLMSLWTSNKNLSYEHPIRIGFYGGDPLVNFSLIEKIVSLCESITERTGLVFIYSMTTNALLLDRYKDFIVRHNFSLLISMDGNEAHNVLRIKPDGEQSFQTVYENVKKLQQQYPDYFQNKVEFNSVLNSHSSVDDIHDFIFNEFGKIPLIETISHTALSDEQKYQEIAKDYKESPEMMIKRKDRSPVYKELGFFFYYQLDNAYKHYCEVLYGTIKQKKRIPTGTCLPFFKKMFVTADNKLLTCERISLHHVLGTVDNEVHLNFGEIASIYNSYYEKMRSQCRGCYLIENCGECFLQFPLKNGVPVCHVKMNEIQYQHYLSEIFGVLEKNPSLFEEVNKMVFA